VVTALFVVPSGSPAAPLAHQVSTGPCCPRRAGDLLRRHLIGCPCTGAAECPAPDQAMLRAALEHAAGSAAVPSPPRAPAPGQAPARRPDKQAPGTMRPTTPPDDTADEVNLTLLRIAYPQFWFWRFARGGRHRLRWTAVRKNGADPGLYAVVTADLSELAAALAADAGPAAGPHPQHAEPGTRP
jgi:hypothetical protein